MVNFVPVTPETEVWEICTFEAIRQKAAYLTEYLKNFYILLSTATEPIFTNVSAFVDVCMGIGKLT